MSASSENRAKVQAAGIYREDGTKDSKRLAALVTAAYDGPPSITAPSDRFPDGQVATDCDELIGHATLDMTMRYAHLSPDTRRDAVRVLDGPVMPRATYVQHEEAATA